MTSAGLTFSVVAIWAISAADRLLRWASPSLAPLFMRCFIERRLKNSLRCALVVASLTIRQFFKMYSWISALIQCSA